MLIFLFSLQPVLVSRFIINLSQVEEEHEMFPDRNISAYSDVVFAGLQRLAKTVETMADGAGQELKFDWQKEEDSDSPLDSPELGNGTDYSSDVSHSEPRVHSTSYSQEDIREVCYRLFISGWLLMINVIGTANLNCLKVLLSDPMLNAYYGQCRLEYALNLFHKMYP